MSPQVGFLLQDQVLPRLRAVIPRSVLTVGAEDEEELVQDSCALAARIMHNAEQQGKTVTASSAAYYALQYTKCGRRLVGNSCVDVHGSSTQLQGKSRLESMEQVVTEDDAGSEIFQLHDVLADDREDPGTKAARKLDWQEFMASLSKRDQGVVEGILEGHTNTTIARTLKVTTWTVNHRKERLAEMLVNFMGSEILKDIQRKPKWKNDILATREMMACKYERCHG